MPTCNCLPAIMTTLTSIENPDPYCKVVIPHEYQEYLELFSKTKASCLPTHHPYDCAMTSCLQPHPRETTSTKSQEMQENNIKALATFNPQPHLHHLDQEG